MDLELAEDLEENQQIRFLSISTEEYAWNFKKSPYAKSRVYFLKLQQKPIASTSFRPIDLKLGHIIYPASLNHSSRMLSGRKDPEIMSSLLKKTKTLELQNEALVSISGSGENKAYIRSGWLYIGNAVLLQKSNCIDRGFSCLAVPQLGKEIDEFSLDILKGFSLAIIKDSLILNWRTENPNQKYVNYLLRPGDLRGYMLLAYRKNEAYIADFKALTKSDLEDMLMTAESFAFGYESLGVWSSLRDPFQEVFLANGFRKAHQEVGIFLRLNEDPPNVAIAKDVFKGNWIISQMDLEMMS